MHDAVTSSEHGGTHIGKWYGYVPYLQDPPFQTSFPPPILETFHFKLFLCSKDNTHIKKKNIFKLNSYQF